MPCAGGKNLTPEQAKVRKRVMAERLDALEKLLLSGRVKLRGDAKNPVFDGWVGADRGDWADACAYRALVAKGSSALRMTAARSQAMSNDRMQNDRMQRGGLR